MVGSSIDRLPPNQNFPGSELMQEQGLTGKKQSWFSHEFPI
jgi:hypothetical protein